MAVTITNEELDLFNKNGFTDDDVRATVENYRSQGLDDNAIRAKVQAKLDSWGTAKQPTKQTRTYPNQSVKNMTEEEFRKNIDTLYDIPQVDMPNKGVLTNSDGEQILTGGVEQKVIPNWDKKGRIYYTDEQGNKIKSNVPLSRKLANKIKTTTTNIGDWLTTDVGEKAKERRKAVALLATAPIGAGAGIGGMALSGALGGGLYSGAEQAIEGKFNPKQLATDIGLGAATGGLLGLGGKYVISPIVKNISRRANIAKRRATPLAERMTEEQLQNVKQPEIVQQVVKEVTEQPTEPAIPKDYQRLYRGLNEEYNPNYDKSKLDNINGYESWTDNYELAKAYGDNVYYIDVPKNTIAKDIIDVNPKSMTYGDRNLIYENDKPVGIKGKSGKEYLLYTEHEEHPNIKYNKISKPQQLDEVIPEQVIQPTGETKLRSFPQSVLEAKGTPKEVKEIIKQDMPTYQVLHNKDLTAQASNELAGNFDNELVRLASAKDFDALDYEKSRQIAKTLFDSGDYQRAVDLIDNVSENATKKGQAIQALSLWSNMSPEGAVYKAQKLVKEYNKKNPKKPIQLTDENIDTIRKLQSEALNTADELERNQAMARSAKYMTDLIPKGFVKKLKAYRNIAMLLNPKTLGRNIVGNVVFNVTDTGSKGLAALIDRGLSKFTGQRTRVAPDLGTYGKGLVQGAKTGYKEALQGIDTRGLGQRYDLDSGRVFESKPMQTLETALDVGLRTPDRAFYEATFAESVQNMMKAQGLKEPTQEILERAEQEALESVFQNKSNVSDLALGLRSGLNKIGTQDFGLGDVLIPYAQTPANLTQQAINYSPLGLIKGGWNLSKGDQRQASLDIARSLIGSGLIGGGYGLAKAGLTTPSQFDENYTRNKAIRENLQPLGIRPDQLGNMWYAPFQPMSSPIATGTAMAYGDNPIFAGLNTVVDQPYLQGVTKGLRDLQEGNWADAGINVASSIPSQFVPTLASQFAQSIDPYQRQTYDPNKLQYGLNSAIAKIPFASKTLPERIDVTGQPIERYSYKGAKRLYDIFLNPTFINKKTDDPVLSELKYIYDQTKETKHFMPTVNKTLSFTDVDGNKQKIKLTGRELSEYQRELGQRMYDEFNYVMDLPEYTNTDDYGKIELLEKAKKLVKDEVDNEMWNKKKQYKKSSYTKGN